MKEHWLQVQEHWQKGKEWYASLAAREQQALLYGSILLAIFIMYAGIWSPYTNHIEAMRVHIQTEQKLLVFMQTANAEIKKVENQAKSKGKAATPVVLLSDLQQQVTQVGLTQQVTELKQSSNESVDIHFKNVDFDQLIRLLTAVIKQESVTISQMSVISQSADGMVNADVVLSLA